MRMHIPVFETGAFSHSAISPNPPTITIEHPVSTMMIHEIEGDSVSYLPTVVVEDVDGIEA